MATFHKWNILLSMLEVEFTDEFEEWWETLGIDEQDAVDCSVGLLEENND